VELSFPELEPPDVSLIDTLAMDDFSLLFADWGIIVSGTGVKQSLLAASVRPFALSSRASH
jgi:hypothetical protein